MEVDESQSVCVDKAFHPHHGRGGGHECVLNQVQGFEVLFFVTRFAANKQKESG